MVGKVNPLERVFGSQVGTLLKAAHDEAGVTQHIGTDMKRIIKDKDGNVQGVELTNGTCLDVDMVIIGVGVTPTTNFLERSPNSKVKVDDKGFVITDSFLQTHDKDIFAAGDVASFLLWMNGKHTNIQHWVNALEQGEQAAHCMLGKYKAYKEVPFFWTRSYNVSIQYVGHCDSYDEVHVVGDTTLPKYADNKFCAFYIKDG